MAQTKNPAGGPSPAAPTQNLGTTLVRVAWLAIALGFAMQAVMLLLGSFPGLDVFAADLAAGVSWSLFVCVGLAVGTTVAKAQLPLAGLAGLLAAPVAFEISRIVHKGVLEGLSASGEVSGGAPFAVAMIKGLEYGVLGMAVAWIGRRPWGGAAAHAATGLLVGLVFGGALVAVTMLADPDAAPASLLAQGVNEVLFPVGCAMVLFSAGAIGRKISRYQ
jgi:hypothetical protein